MRISAEHNVERADTYEAIVIYGENTSLRVPRRLKAAGLEVGSFPALEVGFACCPTRALSVTTLDVAIAPLRQT